MYNYTMTDCANKETVCPTLLLVDDEPHILQMLQDIFSVTPFKTLVAYDGTSALRILSKYPIDLAILDMQLPDMLGTELLQAIHETHPELPCLFLTGMNEEAQVVKGLELGAEDYIVKPFRPQELIVRIKKVLARQRPVTPQITPTPTHHSQPPKTAAPIPGEHSSTSSEATYHKHHLWLQESERTVKLHETPLDLTRLEFDLLYLLIRHENQVLTRNQILNHLWPDNLDTSLRAVDTHIKHLRKKLHDDPQSPTYIHTLRGVGYSFRPENR